MRTRTLSVRTSTIPSNSGNPVGGGHTKSGVVCSLGRIRSRPTVVELTFQPACDSAAASCTRLLHVQRNGDCGSPRVTGSPRAPCVRKRWSGRPLPTASQCAKRLGVTRTAFTWTSYDKPKRIADATTASTFDYAPERRRTRQVQVQGATTTTTTYVGAVFEQVAKTGEATRRVHYIFAGGERVAVYTSDDAPVVTTRLRYLHTDHLGSVDTVTDETGAVVERLSYDAFGKRRTASGAGAWTEAALAIVGAQTPRGFTGHEHLDALGLVHMNGRVYDSALGRFVSADPYVQFPESTQGLNRYGYVRNNSLGATDPGGYTELFGGDWGPSVGDYMDGGTDMSGYDAVGVQTNDGGIAMFDTDTLTASNPGNEPGYYSEFFESVTEDSWSDLFDSPDEVERLVEHGLTTTAPPDGVTDDEVVEAMKEVADIVEVTRPVSPPPVSPRPARPGTTRTKPKPRPITYPALTHRPHDTSPRLLGEVNGVGSSATFDAGNTIRVEPYSHTLGLDLFHYEVDYHHYDTNGRLMPSFVPLDEWYNPSPAFRGYAATGFGSGFRSEDFVAPITSNNVSGRVQWRVTIPVQPPTHGNSSGWNLKVYEVQ